MIRGAGAALAAALFAAPLIVAPARPVAWIGLIGLALAAPGVAGLSRGPATAAACVFLANYTLALSMARRPVNAIAAAGFGLGLLFLLESADLACRTRHAAADRAVIRAQLGRWLGFAVGTLAAVVAALGLAAGLAGAVSPVLAPLVAAGAALGAVFLLALVLVRADRAVGARGTGRR
jgi:hypothetical protein